jgi:hypothetical protein
MACDNLIGVKNILITFNDCDTDTIVGPISHKLANEDLPTWKTCVWNNEQLPHGYTKRSASNASVEIAVIRDTRIPLAWYQGCVRIDMQVEYENGLVYTGKGGGVLGDEKSDTHEVSMEIAFRELDEMLPAGAVAIAA